jgi:AcrR family transcriptional regulator
MRVGTNSASGRVASDGKRARDGELLDNGGMPRRPKTAPRRPPKQERSQETVAVLIEATERVLTKEGYAAATTNRIAEVAGVSIGTLYHYFPTKEALIEKLVHKMWQEEVMLVESRAALLLEAPIGVAVRELVHAFVEMVQRRETLVRRWYSEVPHLGQLELGLELSDRATRLVRAGFEHNRGELRAEVLANLDFASDFVVKMTMAAVRTAARDYPKELASGVLEAAVTDMITRWLTKAA